MLRVLDLFAGMGGFSLGLHWSGGFETAAFCEIEPSAQAILRKNWPGVPIYDDVRTLTAVRLAADGVGRVDVITGGFPCQDLSIAGRRQGIEAARSGLWSEIVRLVGEIRPRFVIVENVANLVSGPGHRPGAWFGRVLGDLAEVGYDAEWHCVPASAVGAPHGRDRVWVLAYPEQEQRLRPVFDPDDAAEAIRRNATLGMQDGLRPQVGAPLRSVPGRWVDQPEADGMADGVPHWAQRLAACGNAVVPQIPELIGRAILAAEAA
jgi:DNA (cytosine-5)-methyltransferase 1